MKRDTRQGCPISALLYLFVAEILSLMLKNNKEIKGIKMSNMKRDVKITQHADDVTFALNDLSSLNIAVKQSKNFASALAPKLILVKHNVCFCVI